MPLGPGQKLGPYEIVAPLGSGGMGEVYRAHDVRLGRDVALKILPSGVAADPAAQSRFETEARAVAALSHPNILALHDIGNDAGTAYVVTELLEGATLRDRMAAGNVPVRKAVEFALAIAQALAAAHAKGVVHRDIKPENVFVTSDGHVKVLDFGLAKLDPLFHAAPDATSATRAVPTDRGVVLGTAGYLAPEQAEGRAVDSRADIFSLGAVLYELVTGARAFRGDSTIDTLHKIVREDPAPIDERSGVPRELQWILAKCLAKDPDDRYQSARDLVVDLKNVLRVVDSSGSLPRVDAAVSAPRRQMLWPAVAAVALLLVAGAAFVALRGTRGGAPERASGALVKERVTQTGTVIDASISPDGKYVAYVVSEGMQSLWVRQLATGSTIQIVPPAQVGFWGVSFTRDGASVAYGLKGPGVGPDGAFFRIPVLGGAPRRLLSGIDSEAVYSPDGSRIAYVRAAFPEPGASALMVANADGSNAHAIATRRLPQAFAPIFFTAPSWSLEGGAIVAAVETRGAPTTARLAMFRSDTGAELAFPAHEFTSLGQVVWMPDGRGLLVIGERPSVVLAGIGNALAGRQIWWVDDKSTDERQITSDLVDYRKVSITSDAKAIVSVATDATYNIWTVAADGSDVHRVSTGKYDGLAGLDWTPDGRILYRAVDGGHFDIWSTTADGSSRRQLTTDGTSGLPSVSREGRVAFVSARSGHLALWTMTADGDNPRELLPVEVSAQPSIAPDGTWIAVAMPDGGATRIRRVSTDGGAASQLSPVDCARPIVSPDGRRIAAIVRDPKSTMLRMAVVSADTGELERMVDIPLANGSMVRWSGDGRALLHNGGGADRANLWRAPLDGSPGGPITRFVDQTISWFAVSRDGTRIALSRGTLTRDAILLRNFR